MATSLVSFRAVHPVLFAGALAAAWLAFSAPSGNADTGTEYGAELGTISAPTPPVNSAISVPQAPEPIPLPVTDPAPVAGVLQPVLEGPTGPIGVPLIPSLVVPVPVVPVPVVSDPAATVAMVLEPVRTVVEAVSPVLGDAAAVLPPAAELVTDVAPLDISKLISGQIGDLSVSVLSGVSTVDTAAVVSGAGHLSAGPLAAVVPGGLVTALLSALLVSAAAVSFAGPSFQGGAARLSSRLSSLPGSSGGPVPAPGRASASGSGSGHSSGGPHSSAAWLSNGSEHLSLPGAGPVSGPLQHVPAPVSFDPGSSPD